MIMGHSREGAIDLLQKEAAVSGLFFNESPENEGEREKESPNGKMEFSWENGILSAPRTLHERGVPAFIRATVTLR